MNNFRIKITDDNGDMHIYTEATKIEIVNNQIEIDYEDQHVTHSMEQMDEITIKTNLR